MNVRNAATCFENRRPGVGTRVRAPSRGNIQRGLLRKGSGAAAGPRAAEVAEEVVEPARLQREPGAPAADALRSQLEACPIIKN